LDEADEAAEKSAKEEAVQEVGKAIEEKKEVLENEIVDATVKAKEEMQEEAAKEMETMKKAIKEELLVQKNAMETEISAEMEAKEKETEAKMDEKLENNVDVTQGAASTAMQLAQHAEKVKQELLDAEGPVKTAADKVTSAITLATT